MLTTTTSSSSFGWSADNPSPPPPSQEDVEALLASTGPSNTSVLHSRECETIVVNYGADSPADEHAMDAFLQSVRQQYIDAARGARVLFVGTEANSAWVQFAWQQKNFFQHDGQDQDQDQDQHRREAWQLKARCVAIVLPRHGRNAMMTAALAFVIPIINAATQSAEVPTRVFNDLGAACEWMSGVGGEE